MADAKQQLFDFLDRRAFLPVLDARPGDYDDKDQDKLDHVQRATEAERERFRGYPSAKKLVAMYRDDLHSKPAQKVDRELKALDLPTLRDFREDFERKVEELGVG